MLGASQTKSIELEVKLYKRTATWSDRVRGSICIVAYGTTHVDLQYPRILGGVLGEVEVDLQARYSIYSVECRSVHLGVEIGVS